MFIMSKREESTDTYLKVIIALLLRNGGIEERSLRDQIKILADMQLPPKDISQIIGRSSNYVSKEMSHLRSESKRGE